jgi:hypothetical protein
VTPAAVTVTAVETVCDPLAAVSVVTTVVCPTPTPRIKPEASTVAMEGAFDTYEMVPPDALSSVSCVVCPAVIVTLVGETRSGPTTQTLAVPVRFPLVAVAVACPAATPVITPLDTPIVAMPLLEMDQVTAPGGESTLSVTVSPTMTHPGPGCWRIVSGAGGTTFTTTGALDLPPAAAVTDAVPSLSALTVTDPPVVALS